MTRAPLCTPLVPEMFLWAVLIILFVMALAVVAIAFDVAAKRQAPPTRPGKWG